MKKLWTWVDCEEIVIILGDAMTSRGFDISTLRRDRDWKGKKYLVEVVIWGYGNSTRRFFTALESGVDRDLQSTFEVAAAAAAAGIPLGEEGRL